VAATLLRTERSTHRPNTIRHRARGTLFSFSVKHLQPRGPGTADLPRELRPMLTRTTSAVLDGHGMCAPAPMRLRLLELLDDLVFAIGCGGHSCGAVSSRVEGIGGGSTHSSSSRSAESDKIVYEKLTEINFHGMVLLDIVGAAPAITGPTGSSSVLPPLRLLSEVTDGKLVTDDGFRLHRESRQRSCPRRLHASRRRRFHLPSSATYPYCRICRPPPQDRTPIRDCHRRPTMMATCQR
jgi:hypothetical protein